MSTRLMPEIKKGDVVSMELQNTQTPSRQARWGKIVNGTALNDLVVGNSFYLTYGKDDQKNLEDHGGMYTSIVQKIEYNGDGSVIVHTMNSVYAISRSNMEEW